MIICICIHEPESPRKSNRKLLKPENLLYHIPVWVPSGGAPPSPPTYPFVDAAA